MARLSNAQGLLFAEISTEEIMSDGPPVTTLKGWFGMQQVGQIKSLITNTVNENKGVVTHTVGDSILSSFADAQCALSAAIGIQRRVAEAQNPSTGMLVKVRIGLAYGPVRVVAGRVSGDSVTAAGVLLEKAQANEILANQALYDAVGAVKETRFEACGALEGTKIYRVVCLAAGAPQAGPAPASAPVPARAPVRAPAPIAGNAPAPTPSPGLTEAPPTVAGATLVLRYAGTIRQFLAADGEVVMGRSKDVHISVPESHVSRKHAKIVWEDGAVPFLVNLSQYGTSIRFAGSRQEQNCMTKIALEGGGEIALCSDFGQVASPGEIIRFSLKAG